MTKAGDKILAGLESALEYAKGNTEGSITHEIEVIDVKEVRKSPLLSGLDLVDKVHGIDSTCIQSFRDELDTEIGSTPCGIRIAFSTIY
ncbi:MAG: hypothetical protein HOH80_22810, partial [Rhodospirillaceae bacterium]|jgi:hypothetical protein|nr:hypothetical protein [Rhodospirillaceae bacterium]MBT4118906.1 hypothetical protein [Rhodospirillaceae bacterium]MBT4673871.1 hypothetical protein [Rhodospirillaceae bacterium]MBT5180719.1 hypothetical protein [Rhodospirillaceae bacterium]MBT5841847.1 hypothetical protein [Rhodospirillaceae bacterium]